MPDGDLNPFSPQQGSAGRTVGSRLTGSIFIPNGVGLIYQDSSGNFWQSRLAQNPDGSTLFDPNGIPTLELFQVNI